MTAILNFRSLASLVIATCFLLGDLATTHAAPKKSRSSKSEQDATSEVANKESSPDKKRITILDLSGRKARKVRRALEDAASEHYEVISRRKYRSKARRLKARKMEPGDVKKVAEALELTAVIDGRVDKTKTHYAAHLIVYAGATGAVLQEVELELPLKLGSRTRDQVSAQFAAVVSVVSPPAGAAGSAVAQIGEPPAPEPPPAATAQPASEQTQPASAAAATPASAADQSASAAGSPRAKRVSDTRKRSPAAASRNGGFSHGGIRYNERGQAIDDEIPPRHTK